MYNIQLIIIAVFLLSCSQCDNINNKSDCVDTYQIFKLINSFIERVQDVITLTPANDPKTKVSYYLYTRLNENVHQELLPGNKSSLDLSNFNEHWPLRFIIPGWLNVHNSCAGIKIKNAYLKKDNFNVIIVNWEDISLDFNYFYLSFIVDKVAKEIALFTKFLNTTKNIEYSNMYLIGHSLGAQIAGSTGKQIVPNKFNTIFALEPAGPMFHGFGFDRIVDASDAEYVEAIQTNIGIAGYYGEGGRASFYPNYGQNQPHCFIYNTVCNHAAAYEYFVESIIADNDSGFIGWKCESFNKLTTFNTCNCKYHEENCIAGKMGGEPSTHKNGVYFLRTNKKPPYSRRLTDNFTIF